MADLLNKMGWGLIVLGLIMVFIAVVALALNYTSDYPKTDISGFYCTILLILIGGGTYLRKLGKRM
jgi:hypothetical protein